MMSSEEIRVLHVIESLDDYGGTPRKLLYLAQSNHLSNIKHDYMVYISCGMRSDFEVVGSGVTKLNKTGVFAIIVELIAYLKNSDTKILSTHFVRPLVLGYLATRFIKIPLIHNQHSSANYITGIGRYLCKYLYPKIEIIVCNSQHTAKSLVKDFCVSPENIRVIYNPVVARAHKFYGQNIRAALGVDEGAILIGHVGGMIASRDQCTLIRSFGTVLEKFPNSRLVLIGDGPERDNIRATVSNLNIESYVTVVGYTDAVADYLDAMDIYINPTLDEGFGIAVVEAMLAGTPVIAADCGAHPEIITDGVDGFLFEAGSEVALCAAIIDLIENKRKRLALANCAKVKAAQFSSTRYSTEYTKVLRSVLHK